MAIKMPAIITKIGATCTAIVDDIFKKIQLFISAATNAIIAVFSDIKKLTITVVMIGFAADILSKGKVGIIVFCADTFKDLLDAITKGGNVVVALVAIVIMVFIYNKK